MKPRHFLWNAARWPQLLAVAIPIALGPGAHSQVPTDPAPSAGVPASAGGLQQPAPGGAHLNPIAEWTSLVATAKAAEEGDADLKAASDQYVTVVRIFDQLRPIAAEALYRYALVEARLEHGEEAQAAHARLIQWFPDFSDYVKRSLEARGDGSLAPIPSTEASTRSASKVRNQMSPEMMSRYGLSPDSAASSAPAAPAAPAARSIPRDVQLADLHDRRAEVVSESARTASELRRARLELRRIEGLRPTEIPPNLVNDVRLRSLLEEINDDSKGLVGVSPEERSEGRERRRQKVLEYVEEVYRPRLQRTVEILSRELDELRRETSEMDMEISKLKPKF